MPTGEVEVVVNELMLLNKAEDLPFSINAKEIKVLYHAFEGSTIMEIT